jgi:hypothetical protein
MLKHKKKFKKVFSDLEAATTNWSVLHSQQSIPFFSSIANLTTRVSTILRVMNKPNGFGVLESFEDIQDLLLKAHLAKLETTMKLLRKSMYVLQREI